MPFKLGPLEAVLILVVILVIFGVGKLPQIGSSLGKSIRAFKEGQSGDDEVEEAEEVEEAAEETKKPRRKKAKKSTARKPKTKTEASEETKAA